MFIAWLSLLLHHTTDGVTNGYGVYGDRNQDLNRSKLLLLKRCYENVIRCLSLPTEAGIQISKDCIRKLSNVSTRKMRKSLPVTNIPTKLESYNKFPTTWTDIYKNDIPRKQINSNSSIHLW
jgi:hypothetical protein